MHTTLPTAAPVAAGSLLAGRYRIVSRLGVGGSAEVWEARDEQLDRRVALKLPHPHLVEDERTRRQLAAEARAVGSLSHPGIVRVYDVADGSRPAVVMELVEGESLGDILRRRGPLPPREVARIGAQVGDALLHAHGRGVIHRDVKPGNILVDPAGDARLVDFGIARLLDEAAVRLTQTGMVAGTLAYMAPEQLSGGELTPRTDVYSLGAVLFHALTGHPPFHAASPVALAEAQRDGPPTLLAAGGADVDPVLAQVVTAALQPDPEQRPRTAGAMADALRAWLEGRPTEPMAVVPHVAEAATVAVPAAAAAHPQRRRLGVVPPVALATVGAALLSLAFVALAGPGDPAGAGATPSPTGTPGWLAALLADHEAACGADAEAPPVEELTEEEARAVIQASIDECRAAAEEAEEDDEEQKDDKDDKDDKDRGNGGEGRSDDNPGRGNGGGGGDDDDD